MRKIKTLILLTALSLIVISAQSCKEDSQSTKNKSTKEQVVKKKDFIRKLNNHARILVEEADSILNKCIESGIMKEAEMEEMDNNLTEAKSLYKTIRDNAKEINYKAYLSTRLSEKNTNWSKELSTTISGFDVGETDAEIYLKQQNVYVKVYNPRTYFEISVWIISAILSFYIVKSIFSIFMD